ncbi:MAG: hypothetical protein EXS05_07835 [Planctomycetaceae bacterium]|nr:hypothetical protein [Planctomycetaceae bacterium]
MTLQPPVKREPFQPPHREPIDDPDALPDVPINYAAESTAAGSEMVTSPVVSVSVESVTIVSAAAAAASDEPAVTATETVRLETNPVTRDAPPEPDPFGTGVEAPPPGTA